MRRVLGLALCVVVIAVWLAPIGEAPVAKVAPRSASTMTSAPVGPGGATAAVRIEHEWIRVPVIASPPRVKPQPMLRHARLERPPGAVTPRPDTSRASSRARRVFFGDGTYRPEPFPRPTKN